MAASPSLTMAQHYALATRHAKRVARLRRWLPLAGGFMFLLFIALTLVNPFTYAMPFQIERFSIRGTKLTMDGPHMTGYMKNKQSYRIRAARAEQDLKDTTKIDLFSIHSDFDIEGGTATLTAKDGVIITDKELIFLNGGVHLVTTTGYEGLSETAHITPKTNLILLPKRVELKSPTGAMSSDRMEIHDGGKFMLFDGNVEGFFIPSRPDADKEPALTQQNNNKTE
jgi:lipopolysaccharide export system protein LptC